MTLIGDDAPPSGTPLADYMGDIIVEIDVLPNMARCLSMIGVAREVAAITGGAVKLPDLSYPRSNEPTADRVKVSDAKGQPAYKVKGKATGAGFKLSREPASPGGQDVELASWSLGAGGFRRLPRPRRPIYH